MTEIPNDAASVHNRERGSQIKTDHIANTRHPESRQTAPRRLPRVYRRGAAGSRAGVETPRRRERGGGGDFTLTTDHRRHISGVTDRIVEWLRGGISGCVGGDGLMEKSVWEVVVVCEGEARGSTQRAKMGDVRLVRHSCDMWVTESVWGCG